MADLTVTLPFIPDPGDRIVWGPLPEGDWTPPEGWKIEGGALVGRWRPGTELVLREKQAVLCGLCGLAITPSDVTISRQGLLSPQGSNPDAHQACYAKAVEKKVSAPGGPASPYVAPGPTTPAWAPNLAVTVGQRYTYGGQTYRVVQAHTTQAAWTPPAVPALWALVPA